jgi:hypothetical protein
MIALDIAIVLRDLWSRLEPHERRRLAEIVRRGRSMTDRDKRDLKQIVRKLEVIDAARRMVPIIGGRRRMRRRRR